jgi:hypothetical protein
MCILDGVGHFILIPHVYRQEVYNGLIYESPYHEDFSYYLNNTESVFGGIDQEKLKELVNTSPVNFFAPKKGKYPNF